MVAWRWSGEPSAASAWRNPRGGVNPVAMRSAGLFFSHRRSARIERHYRRLVRETEGLIDWRFAYNPGRRPEPELNLAYEPAELCMPTRYAEAVRNGGVVPGYTDTMSLPCVLALDADCTWVMEYDVDFSGCWRTLFEQFGDCDADLLTTTIGSKVDSPDWCWWRGAKAPAGVPASRMFRAFHPIMRLSRRFARVYRGVTLDPAWGGHSEFMLPTIAAFTGHRLQDLGGADAGSEAAWSSSNYVNSPSQDNLGPGTFRWRPTRPAYFHEAPGDFRLPDKLYHPIKARAPIGESGFVLRAFARRW